jgi:hypothetical protein
MFLTMVYPASSRQLNKNGSIRLSKYKTHNYVSTLKNTYINSYNKPMRKLFDQQSFNIPHEELGARFARIISNITNPLFVALPTILLIALVTAPDWQHALLWWGIIVGGISIAPYLFIRQGVRRGRFSDHHVSIREQRFTPLLFGLGCVLTALALLLLLHATRPLILTVVGALVAIALATAITTFWKISLHLVGMAGAVTIFCLIFGPRAALLTPLVVIVAWARWKVGAHTLLQALAGTVLAVSVTLAIFYLFGR